MKGANWFLSTLRLLYALVAWRRREIRKTGVSARSGDQTQQRLAMEPMSDMAIYRQLLDCNKKATGSTE